MYCLVLLTVPVFLSHCSLQAQERMGASAEVNVDNTNHATTKEREPGTDQTIRQEGRGRGGMM